MFVYEKKLQYPVKIKNTNPKLAAVIISQYGGPDGELGASLRYLSQRYSMPYAELKGLLTDIGTEASNRTVFFPVVLYQKNPHLRQIVQTYLYPSALIDSQSVQKILAERIAFCQTVDDIEYLFLNFLIFYGFRKPFCRLQTDLQCIQFVVVSLVHALHVRFRYASGKKGVQNGVLFFCQTVQLTG